MQHHDLLKMACMLILYRMTIIVWKMATEYMSQSMNCYLIIIPAIVNYWTICASSGNIWWVLFSDRSYTSICNNGFPLWICLMWHQGCSRVSLYCLKLSSLYPSKGSRIKLEATPMDKIGKNTKKQRPLEFYSAILYCIFLTWLLLSKE